MPARALASSMRMTWACGPRWMRASCAAWAGGRHQRQQHLRQRAGSWRRVLRRRPRPALPVGVHLNLTYGAPLSDPAEIPALLTPGGRLHETAAMAGPAARGAGAPRIDAATWTRLLDLGWQTEPPGQPSPRACAIPRCWPVVIELAQAHGLPVRATRRRCARRCASAASPLPTVSPGLLRRRRHGGHADRRGRKPAPAACWRS